MLDNRNHLEVAYNLNHTLPMPTPQYNVSIEIFNFIITFWLQK